MHFSNLNLTCSKDSFSLLMIDQLLNFTVELELLSSIDYIQDTIKFPCTYPMRKTLHISQIGTLLL